MHVYTLSTLFMIVAFAVDLNLLSVFCYQMLLTFLSRLVVYAQLQA